MIRILFVFTITLASFVDANEKAIICASIEDDKNRLACYDQFFQVKPKERKEPTRVQAPRRQDESKLKYQQQSKKNEALKEKEKEKENKFFGLSERQIQKAKNIKEDASISSSVKSVKVSISGKFSVNLDNGQVWQSQTALPLSKTRFFKKGNNVNIKRARFGGFFLTDDTSGIQFKAKRIK
jgi:hypothetical protein|tara:strand:+ start:1186 stop:1731 length:546 start_codon:yes stop_codon:yes gene_type:complete